MGDDGSAASNQEWKQLIDRAIAAPESMVVDNDTKHPSRFPAPQVTPCSSSGPSTWSGASSASSSSATRPLDLAGRDTNHGVLGLEKTNALQNVIHVVLGLVAMACTSNETSMRVGGVVLAVAGAALTVAGVVGLATPDANVFSQNLR